MVLMKSRIPGSLTINWNPSSEILQRALGSFGVFVHNAFLKVLGPWEISCGRGQLVSAFDVYTEVLPGCTIS